MPLPTGPSQPAPTKPAGACRSAPARSDQARRALQARPECAPWAGFEPPPLASLNPACRPLGQ
ncbi:hypothetical protein M5K25_018334 [Dendrobium thyrsiflorum]|uniref:Uncharacterized protein n=1 Tax=Dendrobium thyrsiflorum TaxID=117978 RepID=A0ABD0UI64_DENTH